MSIGIFLTVFVLFPQIKAIQREEQEMGFADKDQFVEEDIDEWKS